MNTDIKNLKKRVGIISSISILFEIVRFIWTFFTIGNYKGFPAHLLGITILVADAIILKNFVYYFISLIKKSNTSSVKPFKQNLEKWLKGSLNSIIVTTIYFVILQHTNHHCNNYLISHHFTKHIPFYLCMICNTLCVYFFYINAKKYNELIINENELATKCPKDIKDNSQNPPVNLSQQGLMEQLQMSLKSLQFQMNTDINNLKKRVGIISSISILFEIVRVFWTFCTMGNYKDFICQLIGIFILIADVLIIKEYVYYLFGLIKNNSSSIKPFKQSLEKWLKGSLISIIVTTIYFVILQHTNHHCNNYLISHHFTKHIPFYLCMICNTLCVYFFYINAKKYNELIIDENILPTKSPMDIKDKSQTEPVNPSQFDDKSQSDVQYQPEVKPEVQPDVQSDIQSNDQHQSDVKIEIEPQSDVEPQI